MGFLVSFLIFAGVANASPKPPQFVLMAFDGSLSPDMWKETTDFSNEMQKSTGKPFQFTYFISGVYFVSNKNKASYQSPHHKAGASAIGFGGDNDEIQERVHLMNASYLRGNEMGSHANGHFDGSKWSYEDWKNEFDQFVDIIFNFARVNHIPPESHPEKILFGTDKVRGFRAPLLGVSPGLWETLAENQFTYDTSRTSAPNYWPKKESQGFWNFPLAELKISGTAKRTLSMDYNFYYAQSQAKPGPKEKWAEYEKEMYDTYVSYFMQNYRGNRAPVHIGHHFSKWNGGAYWKAMKHFAETVCGLSEVRCVAYRDLADFLDGLEYRRLSELQHTGGEVSYLRSETEKLLDVQVTWTVEKHHVVARLEGPSAELLVKEPQFHWRSAGLRPSTEGFGDFALTDHGDKKVELFLGDKQILTSTLSGPRIISTAGVMEDLEARSLKGDLPEAHFAQ